MVESKTWQMIGVVVMLFILAGALFQVANLSNERSALENDVRQLSTNVDQLQTSAASLEENVAVLADELETKDSELEKLNKELEETELALFAEQAEKEAVLAEKEELEQEAEADATSDTSDKEVIDNLFLGDAVSFSIDDGDLEKLFDGEIEFDEDEYDTHEEFNALTGKSFIMYSFIDDEELGDRVAYGLFDDGALEYRYVFDDTITMADISDDESLEIMFLGQRFEIVEISDSELKFRFGDEFYMNEGQTITHEGNEITLAFVSENNRATVCVNGACEVIDEFDTETISGVDVRVEDILINNREGVATLIVGEDTIINQKDGDEFLDNDDSPFDFYIESTAGELEALVVSYNEQHETVDDDFAPFYVGEGLEFPFGFLTVTFNKVLEADYIEFNVEFDGFSEELEDETDVDKDECVVITTDKEDIEVLDEDVDEVFVCSDSTVYFQDTSGDWFEGDISDVSLVNDDTTVTLDLGGSDELLFENADDVTIALFLDWVNERLGAEENEAEAGDITIDGSDFGEEEYSVLTPYGTVVVEPEANADRDEFTFKLPTDKVEVELVVV